MVHREEITVYKYQKADDGFGGYQPAAPLEQTLAPSVATINQTAGGDIIISERMATSNIFEVFVNYRSDFTWGRDMFIVVSGGPWNGKAFDIENIVNQPGRDRQRIVRLEASYISGVDNTGSGTPSQYGFQTIYVPVGNDNAQVTVPEIEGKTVYLLFRDGVGKEVVSSDPQVNEVMVSGTTLSLVSGDIFYQGEVITIFYG